MKDMLIIIIMFAAAVFALPLLAGSSPAQETNTKAGQTVFPGTVRVYRTESGDIAEITAEEYIEGCLAAQIPINYSTEALRAQACASATFALRLMAELKDSGKLPENADISDDRRICQPYLDGNERLGVYGEEYEKYERDLKNAARYGVTHTITYDGEPVYAVYHSVSAGGTCPSEYIWGQAFPYLRRADSREDIESPNFECTNEIKAETIRSALAHYDGSLDIPVDPARWFTDMNSDENGYVISVNIGKNTFSGGDLWRILGLRSPSFTVKYADGIFTFTTRGSGHGAGLSQYGAESMARAGHTAEEIILHYYGGGVKINAA